jgi:hypothetical protein
VDVDGTRDGLGLKSGVDVENRVAPTILAATS